MLMNKFLIGIGLVLSLSLGLSSASYAQEFRLGLGPELLFPSGNSSNVSAIGGGLVGRAEVQVSDQVSLLASVGYQQFVGRRYLGTRSNNLKYVPVKVGLKYYTDPRFYLEGNLGANMPQNDTESNSLVWALGFGSPLGSRSQDNFLELGLRYEGWTKERLMNANGKYVTFGFISFRLTYNFKL